jgi:proteic killer suppression protein
MEIDFKTQALDKLETDSTFTAGFSKEIVKAYRKRLQAIRAASDERDLYAVKGNRFEKLQGNRCHEHSLRLNDQMRLVVEIIKGNPKNILRIINIEDYH